MPQEIRVLCCFKCKMYQVDIVKKAKKWQCKMCGEKQSVFRELFRGTGAECRQKAQELNFTTKTQQIEAENEFLNLLESDDLELDFKFIANEEQKVCGSQLRTQESKWAKFVEAPKENPREILKVETINNLKRKVNTEPGETANAKNGKSFASTSSKWSAYL